MTTIGFFFALYLVLAYSYRPEPAEQPTRKNRPSAPPRSNPAPTSDYPEQHTNGHLIVPFDD